LQDEKWFGLALRTKRPLTFASANPPGAICLHSSALSGAWLSVNLGSKYVASTMPPNEFTDGSNGYEALASSFMSCRSQSKVGVDIVREWANSLPPRGAILDLGYGNGKPISQVFFDEGFTVYGLDASPSMFAAFRAQFPGAQAECRMVEDSGFFERTFDGVVAWGLIFLLTPEAQCLLIRKVSRALNRGGRFLFTSPKRACEWSDALTGRKSASLGLEAYHRILIAEGLTPVGERQDDGDNHYYLTWKKAQ
jgi:SAM-dependent methyltransferase